MRKKLHSISTIIVLAIIFFIDIHCYAQNVIASGTIDRDSISAGQPFNFKLEVKSPDSYIIDWNGIKDSINNIEIIKKGEVTRTPINNSNDVILSQDLIMTTFDTGYIEIPSIGIKYSKSADDTTKFTCFTDYKDIYVKGVSVDTTVAYKPIKMPIKQSLTVEETIPYFGGVIVLAGLILLITYLIKRSKKKDRIEEEETKPSIPAIVTAREKLLSLKESNLWQSGKSKEYYTDLTDIAREYLEGQFNIEAIEMTSDEILEEVRRLNLSDNIYRKLQETLVTADLVKFAKANPDSSQNEMAFNDINTFVEESYIFHQELEKQKEEEAKAKKYKFEEQASENQEMEETK
ncbi:MAG: hypothetical protein IJZ06_00840 [Bacteroidales bacterium]|nr:hypothetical protein [Bacteroidales bacterium]